MVNDKIIWVCGEFALAIKNKSRAEHPKIDDYKKQPKHCFASVEKRKFY
ncbi:MAG: hypothetical protein LBQ28_04530 [Prevotellaceae bacterium]|jgi:hypothetical protein|nr:hypothetical protein [Prevotellaceae bacterium]